MGILCLSCSAIAGAVHVERSAEAMGTVFTVELEGDDRQRLESVGDRALGEAKRIDSLLSNYLPNSELSRVNQSAAEHPVKVSAELFNLLLACQDYSRKSDGAFDVTVGPLMKAWGFYRDSGRLPRPEEIKAALGMIGYKKVELNESALTVSFQATGMNIDPGGVGKGYAVDRMVSVLRSQGIKSALVSAGGSSIYGLGTPRADKRGWYVEIRDPRNEKAVAASAYLHNQSLSTSGSYEKFFWADGKLYSHIMNPTTGYPAEGVISVSVISPLTLDSEVWAKPFYIFGRAWTKAHQPKTFRVFLCETRKAGLPAAIQGRSKRLSGIFQAGRFQPIDRPQSRSFPSPKPVVRGSSQDKPGEACAWLP